MFYILSVPGAESVYPYTLTDLKRAHTGTSFPGDMTNFDTTPWHCHPVQDTTPPEEPGMVAVRAAPELVGGMWQERWTLEPAPPPPVPMTAGMRQARLVLLQAGLLDQVDIAIAAVEDPVERRQIQITWEYSSDVSRNDPLVLRLATAFGLSDTQVDDLFRGAATL
jgi:hypothetical protein